MNKPKFFNNPGTCACVIFDITPTQTHTHRKKPFTRPSQTSIEKDEMIFF